MEGTKTLTWSCEPVKLDGPFGYFSCKNGKLWEGERKLSYFAVLLTAATSLSGQNSVYWNAETELILVSFSKQCDWQSRNNLAKSQ